MTIPYMREFVAGARRDPAEAEIMNLYLSLGWIFRALDEINAEAQLDKKKCGWLMTHCPSYRLWYAKLAARIANEGVQADGDWTAVRAAGEIAGMAEGVFAAKKMRWATRAAMLSDLGLINDDALAIYDWIKANVPDWGTAFATREIVGYDATGRPIEQEVSTKIALPAGLLTRVATLRGRFAATA